MMITGAFLGSDLCHAMLAFQLTQMASTGMTTTGDTMHIPYTLIDTIGGLSSVHFQDPSPTAFLSRYACTYSACSRGSIWTSTTVHLCAELGIIPLGCYCILAYKLLIAHFSMHWRGVATEIHRQRHL